MAVAPAPTALLSVDAAAVERASRARGEPEALVASRVAAARRYAAAAWPTGAEEEWRRFPLGDLPAGPLEGASATTAYSGGPCAGVIFGSLREAVAAQPELIAPFLEGPDGTLATHEPFRALADALWSEGTVLRVAANVVVPEPLRVDRRWAGGAAAILERTVVVLEAGASATLVEELSSEGGGPGRLAVPHLTVRLGAGARLRYVGIRRLGDDVWDLGFQRFVSERDSGLEALSVVVGGRRSKIGVDSDIRGDGATVRLDGLVAIGGEQRVDVNTLQRLDGRAPSSDLLYLAALYDSAKAVTYGVIRVEPTSSGSGSYQECRNVLLSDKAGAVPIPVLEILTNDVARCGHGATAGSIDENEMFYVMSRGFDRQAAEALLVHGFFQRVVDRIEDESVRQRALRALAPRIGTGWV